MYQVNLCDEPLIHVGFRYNTGLQATQQGLRANCELTEALYRECGAVITQCNMSWYYTQYCNHIRRTYIRLCNLKIHRYLALTGEILGVSCENFGENWLRYISIASYHFVTGDRWIPLTKAIDVMLWRFLWSAHGWENNRDADDLRYHRSHYDVTVMRRIFTKLSRDLTATE